MNEAALKLIDAICEAYDQFHVPKDTSGDGKNESFCNLATSYVCARFGYEKFKGMVANQIIDYMSRKPEEWGPVDLGQAQGLANDGHILIAGAVAEPNGHVVVLRPGVPDLSAKWQSKVPKVGNVGVASSMGKSLSWVFPGPKPPSIWMLRNAPSDLAVV